MCVFDLVVSLLEEIYFEKFRESVKCVVFVKRFFFLREFLRDIKNLLINSLLVFIVKYSGVLI